MDTNTGMFPRLILCVHETSLQGTVKGGRRQGRQRKRWEANIREWTGLEFGKSKRAVEETGCEIICGAPTTLVVKGQVIR